MVLIGMFGCNIAWGLVDPVMFLMSTVSERGYGLRTIRAVQDAATPRAAHRILSDALRPVVSSLMTTPDLEKLRHGVLRMRDLPPGASLNTGLARCGCRVFCSSSSPRFPS
jgi:hypothetical protein